MNQTAMHDACCAE